MLPRRTRAIDCRLHHLIRGETLRGLPLQAFAFWKTGRLAKTGSMVALSAAGVMGLLTLLRFWHLRRVSPTQQILDHVVGAVARKSA